MNKLGVLALTLSTACATIFNGGPDHMNVTTPPGTRVYLDGDLQSSKGGTTELTLDRRHSNGAIRVEVPGCKPQFFQRTKTINLVAILDIFTLLGLVIDVATLNVTEFDEKSLTVDECPEPLPPMVIVPAAVPVPAAPPAVQNTTTIIVQPQQ